MKNFPSTCMLDFWITSFSNRPAHNCVSGIASILLSCSIVKCGASCLASRAAGAVCSRQSARSYSPNHGLLLGLSKVSQGHLRLSSGRLPFLWLG